MCSLWKDFAVVRWTCRMQGVECISGFKSYIFTKWPWWMYGLKFERTKVWSSSWAGPHLIDHNQSLMDVKKDLSLSLFSNIFQILHTQWRCMVLHINGHVYYNFMFSMFPADRVKDKGNKVLSYNICNLNCRQHSHSKMKSAKNLQNESLYSWWWFNLPHPLSNCLASYFSILNEKLQAFR